MNLIFNLIWSVQTLTESLPISSSTHVKFLLNFFNKKINIPKNYYMTNYYSEDFEHFMHITSLVVFSIFLLHYSYSIKYNYYYFFFLALIANFFTGIFYLFFKKINLGNKLFNKFPLCLGLSITTIMLFSFYFYNGLYELNYSIWSSIFIAIIIGAFQGIALLPGVSRLATTITVGSWLGLGVTTAFIFSCLLQVLLIFIALVKSCTKVASFKKFINIIDIKTIIIVIISSMISYKLLIFAFELAVNNKLYYFGFYTLSLLIYEIYCVIYHNIYKGDLI